MLNRDGLTTSLSRADRRRGLPGWNSFFLTHLEPLATLAWYLIVDEVAIEQVLLDSVRSLSATHFELHQPIVCYSKARQAVITQSLPILAARRRASRAKRAALEAAPFPDLSKIESALQQLLEECLLEANWNGIHSSAKHAINLRDGPSAVTSSTNGSSMIG